MANLKETHLNCLISKFKSNPPDIWMKQSAELSICSRDEIRVCEGKDEH